MDIDNLRAFVEVADLGSFSRAAERLHLTQPAVSKRIAALEEALDVQLFDRVGRGITLTEAGRTLLEGARRILASVEDTRTRIDNLSGEVAGRLRLATSHHIGLHRLPEPLRTFTRRWPKVELDIEFMDSEEACREVARGTREMAIVTLPARPDEALNTETIWPDPLVPVAAPDHPLTRACRLDLPSLAEHAAILPGTGTFTRGIIDDAFGRAGIRPRVMMETNYLETIRMMVSIGLGWSVLPRTMTGDGVVELRVAGVSLDRQLGLVTHRRRELSNAARAFAEILRGQAPAGVTCPVPPASP
ncbi:MAG: LysR family transcriptional regulator [Gammaproteobacteria bacterium]|nr:MAG: LysR family transcriptional regulator [Gammaproteobacteria bacterium]